MHREINSPDEIFRRLLFVLYLAVIVVFLVAGLLGVLQQRYDYLELAFLGGSAAVLLRYYGKRHFEFDRLSDSFPYGADEDALDPELSQEVKRLLAEASLVKDDWQHRQKLRQRLTSLLDQNPGLWNEFRQEIGAVFPALADWVGKTKIKH